MPLYHIELVFADQQEADSQQAAYRMGRRWAELLFGHEESKAVEVRVKEVPEEEDDDRMRFIYRDVTAV